LSAVPGRDVKLGALVPGRVAQLFVAEGDVVTAGTVLGEIEVGPANDELTQARATLAETTASLEAAQAKKTRAEQLLARGIVAAQEVEQARAEAVSAASALERARASVELSLRKVSRSQLKAPFDGVVVAVFVRAGEA